MPNFFQTAEKLTELVSKKAVTSEIGSVAEDFLKSLGHTAEEVGEVSMVSEKAALGKGLTPTGSGTSLLSHEELMRREAFYKVSKSGSLTYMGKQPDASLRAGEAVLGLHRDTGAMRVVSESGNMGNDILERFRPKIHAAADESGLLTIAAKKAIAMQNDYVLTQKVMKTGEGQGSTSMLKRGLSTVSGSRRTSSVL